jgi:hypothetical protein
VGLGSEIVYISCTYIHIRGCNRIELPKCNYFQLCRIAEDERQYVERRLDVFVLSGRETDLKKTDDSLVRSLLDRANIYVQRWKLAEEEGQDIERRLDVLIQSEKEENTLIDGYSRRLARLKEDVEVYLRYWRCT